MEKISLKKKIVFISVSVLLLIFIIEIVCRSFWFVKYHVNFFKMGDIIYVFYPQVKNIEKSYNSSCKSVLLLGGSVLHDDFGRVEYWINNYLSPHNINVYNVSAPGHTSLDSYYKYYLMKNLHFDAILFYHGINETRANNCPENIFRKDYSHYSWYLLINSYFKHKEIPYFVSYYTFVYLFVRALEKYELIKIVPTHDPLRKWVIYGDSIKTMQSFENNLKRICNIAKDKKDGYIILPLFLLNRSSYIDTTSHYSCPASLWGIENNVRKGVNFHNMVIKKIKDDMDNVVLIDMYRLMQADSNLMVDICHFNSKGSERFARIVCDTIIKYVEKE